MQSQESSYTTESGSGVHDSFQGSDASWQSESTEHHTATVDASPAPIVPPNQQIVLLLVGLIGSGKVCTQSGIVDSAKALTGCTLSNSRHSHKHLSNTVPSSAGAARTTSGTVEAWRRSRGSRLEMAYLSSSIGRTSTKGQPCPVLGFSERYIRSHAIRVCLVCSQPASDMDQDCERAPGYGCVGARL